jgi:hypothetical protein
VLRCHPATPSGSVQAIEVRATRPAPTRLELSYAIVGALACVRLPAARPSQFADRLWEHTCFEAFIANARGGYCELNFSPSTQWAVYRFSAYRNDMSLEELTCLPEIRTRSADARFTLDVRLDLAGVPGVPHDAGWRLALSAVIEEIDGTRSYWALAHPAQRPDFHHPDGFVLDLPARVSPSGVP